MFTNSGPPPPPPPLVPNGGVKTVSAGPLPTQMQAHTTPAIQKSPSAQIRHQALIRPVKKKSLLDAGQENNNSSFGSYLNSPSSTPPPMLHHTNSVNSRKHAKSPLVVVDADNDESLFLRGQDKTPPPAMPANSAQQRIKPPQSVSGVAVIKTAKPPLRSNPSNEVDYYMNADSQDNVSFHSQSSSSQYHASLQPPLPTQRRMDSRRKTEEEQALNLQATRRQKESTRSGKSARSHSGELETLDNEENHENHSRHDRDEFEGEGGEEEEEEREEVDGEYEEDYEYNAKQHARKKSHGQVGREKKASTLMTPRMRWLQAFHIIRQQLVSV